MLSDNCNEYITCLPLVGTLVYCSNSYGLMQILHKCIAVADVAHKHNHEHHNHHDWISPFLKIS